MNQSFFKIFLKPSLFFILSFFTSASLAELKSAGCKSLFLGLKSLPETPESISEIKLKIEIREEYEKNRKAELEAKKEPNFERTAPLPLPNNYNPFSYLKYPADTPESSEAYSLELKLAKELREEHEKKRRAELEAKKDPNTEKTNPLLPAFSATSSKERDSYIPNWRHFYPNSMRDFYPPSKL